MKLLLSTLAALAFATLIAQPAQAAIPMLNVVCGDGIEVHADAGGPVYINGSEATLETFNANYYEAKLEQVTISIAINTDGTAGVSYTGPNRANGVCLPTPGSERTAAPGAATIPFFNAECPGELFVHADEGGPIYLNGKEAEFASFSETYFEASADGTTVSVTTSPDGSLDVSYTGPGRANGVCRLD